MGCQKRFKELSLRLAHGVTFTPGTRFMMNSAATVAFGFPTSFCLAQIESRYDAYYQDTAAPEEELSVQVADVDGVHVNDVNILEPG